MRHLLRLLLLLSAVATLCGAACSSDNNPSPTTPSGIPNVAGTWAGQYHIKSCTDTINGTPGTLCATIVDPPSGGTNINSTQPLQLMLTQKSDQVGGTLVFSGWVVQSVPVTGTVGTSGRVWLNGTIAITDPTCPTATGTFTLNGWVTDLNRQQNELTGSFGFTTRKKVSTSGCIFADLTAQSDTVDITKKPATSTTTTTTSTPVP
jgi:hypothetical protein